MDETYIPACIHYLTLRDKSFGGLTNILQTSTNCVLQFYYEPPTLCPFHCTATSVMMSSIAVMSETNKALFTANSQNFYRLVQIAL